MATILALLDLAGSIALLLWGVHMVRSGIERAFGSDLRRLLGVALGNRFKAFGAGLGVTALLQSSTATGLMIASFTASGLVDLVPALGGMLGANVGTTLIVQILAFDVSRFAAVMILIGVVMFRRNGATPFGAMSNSVDAALKLATFSGMPVVRVGRGNASGFVDPTRDPLAIAGSNLTATKARLLLMACLMKFGCLPPAADPAKPTAAETEATKAKLKEYQKIFDTH